MRRSTRTGPASLLRSVVALALLAVLLGGLAGGRSAAAAQDASPTPVADGPLIDVALDPMPLSPSFLRLIRITMQPGSSIPMRSHPGPKIDRIESGTLTMVARDEGNAARVAVDGGEPGAVEAGAEVAVGPGGVVILPIDTFYAYSNTGDTPIVMLSAIMLPAGHQRPPGITYADGEPASDAYDGVTNQILGDGVATIVPTSPGRFRVDQVTVTPDQPLPATTDPTLLSNTANGVQMTVDSGRIQVSRTVTPGPQRDAEPGSEFILVAGDGLFFPEGSAELSVPDGALTFLRVTLSGGAGMDSGASTGVDGTPVATGGGVVTITSTGSPPSSNPTTTSSTPAASRTPRNQPTQTPTAEPTTEPTGEAAQSDEPPAPEGSAGGYEFQLGQTVATTDISVNVRAEPSSTAEIVQEVDAAGTQFVVIGQPVSADGVTWYPVQSLDDPSVSGWIAGDLLQAI